MESSPLRSFLSHNALVLHNFNYTIYDLNEAIDELSKAINQIAYASTKTKQKEKLFEIAYAEVLAWRIVNGKIYTNFKTIEEWAKVQEQEKYFFDFLSFYRKNAENIFSRWFGHGYLLIIEEIVHIIVSDGLLNTTSIGNKIDAVNKALDKHGEQKKHFEQFGKD